MTVFGPCRCWSRKDSDDVRIVLTMKGVVLAGLAIAAIAVGVRWGTFVAGGSDSYCYAHQAEGWRSLLGQGFGGQAGRLQTPEPLAVEAPWPNAALTFAPAGHVPSPTSAGASVPICPAGLSIAMALFQAVGGPRAVFFVVPLFGALFVVATYVAGARFGGRVGVASAALAAASPAFLFQLVQPMSDVLRLPFGCWPSPPSQVRADAPHARGICHRCGDPRPAEPCSARHSDRVVSAAAAGRSWPERLRAAVVYALVRCQAVSQWPHAAAVLRVAAELRVWVARRVVCDEPRCPQRGTLPFVDDAGSHATLGCRIGIRIPSARRSHGVVPDTVTQ